MCHSVFYCATLALPSNNAPIFLPLDVASSAFSIAILSFLGLIGTVYYMFTKSQASAEIRITRKLQETSSAAAESSATTSTVVPLNNSSFMTSSSPLMVPWSYLSTQPDQYRDCLSIAAYQHIQFQKQGNKTWYKCDVCVSTEDKPWNDLSNAKSHL